MQYRFRTASLWLFLGVALAAVPAQADLPPCTVDGATGLHLPETIPGICLVESASVLRLVQLTNEGLLIVIPESDPWIALQDSDDGTRSLRVHDRTALMIYCPASQLDPLGSPRTACLTDFDGLITGPSAYLGFGTVQASAMTRSTAGISCGASMHVLGEMLDGQGGRFDLHSSLVFAQGSGDGQTAAGCPSS